MGKLMALAVGLAAALVAPALAVAQNPSSSAGEGTEIQRTVASGVAGAQSGGSLPFTGLSLTLIVIVAVALVATGILLRRQSRAKADG
jgi:hypothetical protein